MSMDSLSQLYNQSLRLKFGSAPAQLLLGKGEHAERSLEKRVSAIKNQFNLDNLVNTKSQMTKQLASKHMNTTGGQLSNRNNANSSWLKLHDEDGLPTYKSSNLPDSQMKTSKKSLDLSLARATVNTNLTSGNGEYRHKKDMAYDEEDDYIYEQEQRVEGELEGEEDLNDSEDEEDEDDDVVIGSTSKNQANVMRHHGKKSSTKYPIKRPNPAQVSGSSSNSSSANSSSMKILGKIYS